MSSWKAEIMEIIRLCVDMDSDVAIWDSVDGLKRETKDPVRIHAFVGSVRWNQRVSTDV